MRLFALCWLLINYNYFAPTKDAKYHDHCVCMSVCLYVCHHVCLSYEHVSKTRCPNFTTFSIYVAFGFGSVLLFTCNFMCDFVFTDNGKAWMMQKVTLKGQHWGKVWCLRLLCYYCTDVVLINWNLFSDAVCSSRLICLNSVKCF